MCLLNKILRGVLANTTSSRKKKRKIISRQLVKKKKEKVVHFKQLRYAHAITF